MLCICIINYRYNEDNLRAIIVEYIVDGKTYREVSSIYSNNPKSIGTEVDIKYNPKDPSEIIWVNDSINIILPIISILFILVGIFIIKKNIKNKNISSNVNNSNLKISQQEQIEYNDDFKDDTISSYDVENSKIDKVINISSGIYTILFSLVFLGFCLLVFIKGSGVIERIAITPFIIAGFACLIYGINILFNGNSEKRKKFVVIERISQNVYLFGFLLFWFGFLIFFDYLAIKDWSDGGSTMFFFSFVFWAAGIYILVKKFKK